MIRLGLKGEVQAAYELHYKLMDVINYIFEENNPVGIKAVFEVLGMAQDTVRLPLVPATNALKEKIKKTLSTIDWRLKVKNYLNLI